MTARDPAPRNHQRHPHLYRRSPLISPRHTFTRRVPRQLCMRTTRERPRRCRFIAALRLVLRGAEVIAPLYVGRSAPRRRHAAPGIRIYALNEVALDRVSVGITVGPPVTGAVLAYGKMR